MRLKRATRGQATIETAIFLPLFLLGLYGAWWIVQTSVINERTQLALRYSALVSTQANPYDKYGLTALYTATGPNAPSAPSTCAPPDSTLFVNASPAPSAMPPFFQPNAGSINGTCTTSSTQLNGGGLVGTQVFRNAQIAVSAKKNTPPWIQAALHGSSPTTLSAAGVFLASTDVPMLIRCYPELATAVGASLAVPVVSNGAINGNGSGNTGPTAPLPPVNPTNPLSVDSANCK